MKRNNKVAKQVKMDSIVKNPDQVNRFGWVTAQELTKKAPDVFTGKLLERVRKYNYFLFQATTEGTFRYEMKSAAAFLKQYRQLQSA